MLNQLTTKEWPNKKNIESLDLTRIVNFLRLWRGKALPHPFIQTRIISLLNLTKQCTVVMFLFKQITHLWRLGFFFYSYSYCIKRYHFHIFNNNGCKTYLIFANCALDSPMDVNSANSNPDNQTRIEYIIALMLIQLIVTQITKLEQKYLWHFLILEITNYVYLNDSRSYLI